MNELKTNINKYKEKYAKSKEELIAKSSKPLENINVGDIVYVNSFAKNAKVLSVDDAKDEVLIELGAIKMNRKKRNLYNYKEKIKEEKI